MHCDGVTRGKQALGQHPSIRRQANGKDMDRCRHPSKRLTSKDTTRTLDSKTKQPASSIRTWTKSLGVPVEAVKSQDGTNGSRCLEAEAKTTTPTVSQALGITNSASCSSAEPTKKCTKPPPLRCVAPATPVLQDEPLTTRPTLERRAHNSHHRRLGQHNFSPVRCLRANPTHQCRTTERKSSPTAANTVARARMSKRSDRIFRTRMQAVPVPNQRSFGQREKDPGNPDLGPHQQSATSQTYSPRG